MLSPPLRGRAGVAVPRSPAYRRSTSLGVAAASPVRARPASMVTLSTGRSVPAPPMPRRDYDPCLSRALAALEVPGAHVPRVLLGRRLYNSSSSSPLGSAGSSVNSSSPSSPAGLPADFGSLRPRPRPLDSGRLARSRSGIFGELKEKPEVPLARTRTTVFGSMRAGSVLREDKDAEADGGRTLQRRPWRATVVEDAVVMQDVTPGTRSDVSLGINSGGSRGRSAAGSVSLRRSASRASVADAETGSMGSTALGVSGSVESQSPLGRDHKAAGAKGTTGAGCGHIGGEKSAPRASVAGATRVESTGSSQENGNRQSRIATSEAGTGCDAKQTSKEAKPGAAPKSESSLPAVTCDKRAVSQQEKQTSKQETANKAAKIKPSHSSILEKIVATPTEDSASVDPATYQKDGSLEKPLVSDAVSVSGQHSSRSTGKQKDSPKDSGETNLTVSVSVKFKQMDKEQTGKEASEQVNKYADASTEKADKVKGYWDTGDQAAGKHPDETKPEAEPTTKVKKVKKKATKKLLNVDKEESQKVKDISKADKPEQTMQSDKDQPKEGKQIEVKDDINNNVYLKKSPTDNNLSITTEPYEQLAAPNTMSSFTAKPSEVDSVLGDSQDYRLTNTSRHDTNTATKEKKCFTSPKNGTTTTKTEELTPYPCGSAARRFEKARSPAENKTNVNNEITLKYGDGSNENHLNTKMSPRESGAKSTGHSRSTDATLTKLAGISSEQAADKSEPSTASAPKDDRSIAKVKSMGTAEKVLVQSGVTSKTSTVPPPADSRSPEKVTVTHSVGAPHAAREPHSSDAVGLCSATGSATVKPGGKAGFGDKPEQEQSSAVKHRDFAGRKSGLTDKEKAVNRNAAVIGDRLIIGEMESGVPCISGKQKLEVVQSGNKHVANYSLCGTSGAGITSPEKQAKHKSTVIQNSTDASDTTRLAKNNNGCNANTLPKINDQKSPQAKQDTCDNIGTAIVKKKVKIVKKKPPASSEAKQIKLTTVEHANKLQFPTRTLTNLSPFLRADQEKKNSKNSQIGATVSKLVADSDKYVKQNESIGAATEKSVKVRKKKISKTPSASKRSEKHGQLEVQEKNKTRHSVENACSGNKRVPSGGLKPSVGNSKSGGKRVTKGKKSNSARLDTEKLKSKSERSSSSESYFSSECDSEEELSPLERAKRNIREEREREEARKIEKFRRRGQRAKMKMERVKMEDDPEGYIKTPGNLRFAFMIKQDEWMRKQEEVAQKQEAQSSQVDGAPPTGPVTSLGDELTSSGARRRPSADIDESPFDRRIGPLGGPPPKFRQYALEDFRLLRVLGQGAFGKVMLARMKDTRNYFAIKCLSKDKILNDEDVEDTLIERKILTLGTNHPYLCHLFCTFQSPSHLFFVLEFLNGGDLNFHLGQMGRFNAELTRFYASELVCGLRFLHKRGIMYRDLKLDNVLLDHEGHVRIADFGMCKMQIFLDRTADAFCGTVDYMAPEVVSGKNYNQSVDWWSFGIMLYEMLVGLTPFIGLDEDELFWAIRTEQPFYPRFLEPDATEIIKWLLVKDPALRLGSPECPAGGICSQPFFRRVDWYHVERKQQDPPPFRPTLLTMADCRYFEDDYTALPARLTNIPDDVLSEMRQDRFANFDYTNPNMTD